MAIKHKKYKAFEFETLTDGGGTFEVPRPMTLRQARRTYMGFYITRGVE